jgi:hypothetical protein
LSPGGRPMVLGRALHQQASTPGSLRVAGCRLADTQMPSYIGILINTAARV